MTSSRTRLTLLVSLVAAVAVAALTLLAGCANETAPAPTTLSSTQSPTPDAAAQPDGTQTGATEPAPASGTTPAQTSSGGTIEIPIKTERNERGKVKETEVIIPESVPAKGTSGSGN